MSKIFVIAFRDFFAAIKTKSFLMTIFLMPVLMGGGVIAQALTKKHASVQARRFAIVDRTPDAKVFALLEVATNKRNKEIGATPSPDGTGSDKPRAAPFVLERVEVEDTAEAVNELRVQLSNRVKENELWGFLEIGPEALTPLDAPPPRQDRAEIRYQTNHHTSEEFPTWAERQILASILALNVGSSQEKTKNLVANLGRLVLSRPGLSEVSAKSGTAEEPTATKKIVRFLLPLGAVMLMFMVVLMSTSTAMQAVVEEKMQRIAEVLLGSVPPFQLMMGKLLGVAFVSLSIAGVYLAGAYWAAHKFDVLDKIPARVLGWFFLFQVLAVFMYGSMLLAIGAAATEVKETQTLFMPVMLVFMIPMFLLNNVLEDPNQPVVVGASFFPPSAPMLMMARLATDPGPPSWQPPLAAVLVLLVTVVCVWAAGRVFRVGILMQGKGAKLTQMMQWVFRG